MKLVNVYEARAQFSRLLDEAEAGEEVVIARNGKPVVRLVPVNPPSRVLGRFQGQVLPLSDDQWNALDDEIAALFTQSLQ